MPKPELEFTTVVYVYMKLCKKEEVREQSKIQQDLRVCRWGRAFPFPQYAFGCVGVREGGWNKKKPQYLVSGNTLATFLVADF